MKLSKYSKLAQTLIFKGIKFTTYPSVEDDLIQIKIGINVEYIDDVTISEINKVKEEFDCSVFIKDNILLYE